MSPIRVSIVADVELLLHDLLSGDSRFEVAVRPCTDETGLIAFLRETNPEAIVTRYHNRLSRTVLESAPRLRLVVQGTSGLDNIDHDAARERGVEIRGIPGENANAVAELVIGHLIALTRTVPHYDRMVRGGIWRREDCTSRRELRSYRLGIIGLGRVGGRVAHVAGHFGMVCTAWDPYIEHRDFIERGATRAESLKGLLRSSDAITLHVPLTDETRSMIGTRELELLPDGALVINASRGPVLDLAALLASLASGHLGGAALDVFDPEPPTGIEWPDDPRLILTPHIAGCTREAKESLARRSFEILCEVSGV